MINLYVKNGNYNLAITLPSNYLREELHYADVSFSTPVSGTEDISVTGYAETEKAFVSQDLKGTEAMMNCVQQLEQQAKEEVKQYKEMSM